MTLTPQQISHREFIKSDTWSEIKSRLFEAREKKCERCGSISFLQVHHKTYKRFGGKEKLKDLEILCGSCHQAHHGIVKGKPTKKNSNQPKQNVHYYTKLINDHFGTNIGRTRTFKQLAKKLELILVIAHTKRSNPKSKKYIKYKMMELKRIKDRA